MGMDDNVKKIRNTFGDPDEVCCGLAEECGELIQAILKYRRVVTKMNPTPMKFDEAVDHMYEEAADVLLYIEVLGLNKHFLKQIMEQKAERWVKRLEARG